MGASTALFALVHAVVLKPLPFPAPDRLVRVFDTNPEAGVARTGATTGNLADWRRRARSFTGIAGYYSMGRTLTADGASEVVLAAQVTEDFFPVLGVSAAVGRTFTAEEVARAQFNSAAAPQGADPVVVLGYRLWQYRFGGDPQILGRSVILERRPFRVVGVMPDGFAMPEPAAQIWLPWDLSGDLPRDQHYLGAVARLAPGVTQAEGLEDLQAVARAWPASIRRPTRAGACSSSPSRRRSSGPRAAPSGCSWARSASSCWWPARTWPCSSSPAASSGEPRPPFASSWAPPAGASSASSWWSRCWWSSPAARWARPSPWSGWRCCAAPT